MRHFNWLPPICAQLGIKPAISVCALTWELNLQHFGLQDVVSTNWTTSQGCSISFLVLLFGLLLSFGGLYWDSLKLWILYSAMYNPLIPSKAVFISVTMVVISRMSFWLLLSFLFFCLHYLPVLSFYLHYPLETLAY